MACVDSSVAPARVPGDCPPEGTSTATTTLAVLAEKDDDVVVVEKEEAKEELLALRKLPPKVLVALSPRHKGKSSKTGKFKKMPPIGKHGKLAKAGKYSKRPPYALKSVKVKSDSSVRIKSGICLLSIRAAIIGKGEVQLPVWRPSVIQEKLSIGDVISLWAERTFGHSLRRSQLPKGVRCYAGNGKGQRLEHDMILRKIKRKLPLVDGRLSIFIAWPLADSGMTLDDRAGTQLVKHQSWAIKRGMGESNHALAKIGALVPTEEPRRKKAFLCYAFLRDHCNDPDCQYAHYRM